MARQNSPGRLYQAARQLEQASEEMLLGPVSTRTHWAHSRRHVTGAFYTPNHLVHFVVQQTLLPVLRDLYSRALAALRQQDEEELAAVINRACALRVVDPACGSGRFLLAAFRPLRALHVWLARHSATRDPAGRALAWETGTLAALRCLHGIDTNAQAVHTTRQVLALAAGLTPDSTTAWADLSPRIAVGDSLHVTGDENWDVVLGNPPWGAAGASSVAAAQVGLPAQNANTFSLFVARSLQALAPGGRLGFVLPRNFCKGSDYASLRRQMLTAAAVEWLVDAGQAFPGVTQEAVVVVVRRLQEGERPGYMQVCRIANTGALSNVRMMPQHSLMQLSDAPLYVSGDATSLSLIAAMERPELTVPLRQVVRWARGLEYGQDGTLLRCPDCGEHASLPKKKQLRKVCSGCGRPFTGNEERYQLIAQRPDSTHTLPIYVGRHVRRYALASPYWLDPDVAGVRYKQRGLFAGPKLLLPKIAPFLAAAGDVSDSWTTQGVYILRPQPGGWDLWALLGLLNSAPLSCYYEHRYNDGARLTTNVTLSHLLSLPIPAVSPPQVMADMAAAARELNCVAGTCGSEQPAAAPAQVAHDHPAALALDRMVAELFGLTPAQARFIQEWRERHPAGGCV